jgi:diacylglycerol kinase
MEVHMDLTSPEFHPFARDTKDIAAGGVLIAGMLTLIVSLIIFAPKIICLI